jgi:hypothetical protein
VRVKVVRLVVWVVAAVSTLATILIISRSEQIAAYLEPRIGTVGIVGGGVFLLALMVWIATKLED